MTQTSGYLGDSKDARDERHPHIIAKDNLEQMLKRNLDPTSINEVKKMLFVVDGIIKLATSITETFPDLCYLNACELIEEFLFDPLHEQS